MAVYEARCARTLPDSRSSVLCVAEDRYFRSTAGQFSTTVSGTVCAPLTRWITETASRRALGRTARPGFRQSAASGKAQQACRLKDSVI